MNKESNFCTESRPVRLGDFLYIFSDGYGNVNYSSVEITDGDTLFYVAELQNIWTAEEYCFADNSNDYRFILPLEWVREEKSEPEPKYRPYTIKDFEKAFLKGEFEDFIIFRSKDKPDNILTMRYNGNFIKDKIEYICLGAKNFSFESLFDNYEVADYDGNWKPFGIKE